MKGEHDQNLLNVKTKFDTLNKEIIKLKAYVNVDINKEIIAMESMLAFGKVAYDNVNNDNISMHQIIKGFQKDLLEKMIERLMSLNKLHKLKE